MTVQAGTLPREAVQAALRTGLRAVARQPVVLSRWRTELSTNAANSSPDIAWIPGAESLAMLAAMPLEMRQQILTSIGLTTAEQDLLHPVVAQLTAENHGGASRLMRALPYAAHTGASLGADPAPEPADLPTPVRRDDATKTALTLAERRDALTPTQRDCFRALTLFQFPVPWVAMAAVLVAVGDDNPELTRQRLLALELLNRHANLYNDLDHFSTDPLAHPLFPPPLTAAEETRWAQAALPPLFTAWRTEAGRLPLGVPALEAFRLALLAEDPPAMDEAATAGGFWLFHHEQKADLPLSMVRQTLAAMEKTHHTPSPNLLNVGAKCAKRLGEESTRRALLGQAMALPQRDTVEWAGLWIEYAEMLADGGDLETAAQWLQRADGVFQQLGDTGVRTVTLGLIADILQRQGRLDEALRMQEERLALAIAENDPASHASALFALAHSRLEKGSMDPGDLNLVLDQLTQSFAIVTRIGQTKGIAAVGLLLGEILVRLGQPQEALTVLQQSETACQKLQWKEPARLVAAMIQRIQNIDGTPATQPE
ncbi:MAG: tetratricopeptide repeat protein [Magnetococcales bacterium]|nr:tetratricopeptide repeat protein [Magnetococcales bacterium]